MLWARICFASSFLVKTGDYYYCSLPVLGLFFFFLISPRFICIVPLDRVCLEDFPIGDNSQHMLKSEWTLSELGGLSGLG